ncbi:nucleotidyl transferase AbiEii/AbiGii toxin family protein [Candidatus Dojkabacteria bacterium]|nr:nucleotidyl transferase AbiEii/AbiGii toxin family protein [Candidatus Dojkabacteria bacterium]
MRKLYKEVLPNHSFMLLEELMKNKKLKNFYLVGGTALSLQIGHRESIDLDLFSQEEFPSNLVDNIEDQSVIRKFDNSIETTIHSTKVFLFNFNYPLYEPLVEINGIRLANPIDIGLMKLLALQGRTTKKDIIDLYFIDKEIISLEKLLTIFEDHYPKESFNSYQSFKAVIDKNQVNSEPDPSMLEPINWAASFEIVQNKINQHIKSLLNLN